MCFHFGWGTAIGLFVLGLTAWQFWQHVHTHRWDRTEGIVEGHDVRTKYGPDAVTFYESYPIYRYTVNGIERRGTRVSVYDTSEGTTRADAMETIARRFPLHARITVYYDRENPGRTVLQRDLEVVRPLLFVAGAVVFIIADHPFMC